MGTEEGDKTYVKENNLEVNLELAASTCQCLTSEGVGWSQLGLYCHAPVGVVRSLDCGIELEGCSRSLVLQVSWFPIQLVFIRSDLNSTYYITLHYQEVGLRQRHTAGVEEEVEDLLLDDVVRQSHIGVLHKIMVDRRRFFYASTWIHHIYQWRLR